MIIVMSDLFQLQSALASTLKDPACTVSVAICGDGSDSDGDGLSDSYETSISNTDPTYRDTDNDGPVDGLEWKRGWDPLMEDCDIDSSRCQVGDGMDTDGDFLSDSLEATLKSNSNSPDSDSDGIDDYSEYYDGEYFVTDINDPDTDSDGLSDYQEDLSHTNPSLADTDQEGYPDGDEVRFGKDPNDPNSIPGLVTPESPIGGIAVMVSSLAALGGYLALKTRKNDKQ